MSHILNIMSCRAPSLPPLDSPLPLEATPLPSSLLSPKLAITLENGVATGKEKHEQQPTKMAAMEEVEEKPAGSPPPLPPKDLCMGSSGALPSLDEIFACKPSELLLDINQLLAPLKSVLAASCDVTR